MTLDAVDTRTYVGLQPTNASLNVGSALYATDGTGVLTPVSGDAFEAVEVGYFLNFEPWKGGSLVTTPVSLVSAPNSPVGQGQPQNANYQRALIHFNPPDQS